MEINVRGQNVKLQAAARLAAETTVQHAAKAQMCRIMLQKQHVGSNALMVAVSLREVARFAVEPAALFAVEDRMKRMPPQNQLAVSSHPGVAAKSQADAEL